MFDENSSARYLCTLILEEFVGKGATLFWPFSGGEFQTNLYIWSKLMAAHFSAGYDDLGNCKVCKKSFKVSFYHRKKEFEELTLLEGSN